MGQDGVIANAIYEDLLARILGGDLAPGTRLPAERELAASFGTNRNTLREAIRKLEQGRLVSVRQGRGVTVEDYRRVATLDVLAPYLLHARDAAERVRVVVDLLFARTQVVEMAVATAAGRAGPEDVTRLRQVASELVAHFEGLDRAALVRTEFAWLDALVTCSHSLAVRWTANTLLGVYRQLMERFPAMWVVEPSYPDYLHDVIAAIARGDAKGAAALTRDYYDRTDQRLGEILRMLFAAEAPPPPPGPAPPRSLLAEMILNAAFDEPLRSSTDPHRDGGSHGD